ncbi:hypothetical protein JW992_04645 [candidate division KSB1 bacterium]|nr:hypothetical protein [candidate division KSB1 bacterium]
MNWFKITEAAKDYRVVLAPDRRQAEWWAGAPSVAADASGILYLAARMREGDSPRGRRGYEIRILQSRDGITFSPVHRIQRDQAGVSGFERPALRRDPHSGLWKLYGCSIIDQGWAVFQFDDAPTPADFKPDTLRPVLTPPSGSDEFARVVGYKDPVLFWDGVRWHLFVIALDFVERIRHFLSNDGINWEPASADPVLENCGWHNFYTRPACVLPLTAGYLFVYEGSHCNWRDPAYNIATGLAFSPDLERFIDLTPEAPLFKSTTPGDYHTWRYSDWLVHQGKLLIYFEAACPDNSNEIRVAIVDVEGKEPSLN